MSDVAIGEHAFLSDGNTTALVTREGSVDWLCLPRADSPAVLARLLDEDAGHLLLRPADPEATATRRYLPQTLVLETTWTCPRGELVVLDALALSGRRHGHDIGRDSPGALLRRARCTRGDVDVVLEWAPRPENGLIHPRLQAVPGGCVAQGGSQRLVLSTDVPLEVSSAATARAAVLLAAGEGLAVMMTHEDPWGSGPSTLSARTVHRRLNATARVWRSWSALHQRYRGPLEEQVHLSGLVLQGLTHARTGAVLAAATTSLPEGVGTGRTWDYRYTWIRDASMTLRGLWVAACPQEAHRFFDYLARAAATQLDRGVPLQIMYGLGGERDLSERELPHLSGWRSSAPVRVGNDAWRQRQQDVYGALLDAALVMRERVPDLDPAAHGLLVQAVEAAAATWKEPDQGIWEVRGPPRRYLHSAVMCWVALDRGIALAGALGAEERVPRWSAVREEVRSTVLTQGWNRDVGAYTQSLGSAALDASVLSVILTGMLDRDDPRAAATVDAVRDQLTDAGGLVLRYRGGDGLPGREGSFLLCTFWLAEAMAVLGRTEEAEDVLGRAAGCANDLGLLAEQVDSDSGELLGNFPQAFSHLGLVLAAEALARARTDQEREAAPAATSVRRGRGADPTSSAHVSRSGR